jgi:hypothetical protein
MLRIKCIPPNGLTFQQFEPATVVRLPHATLHVEEKLGQKLSTD